MVTWKDAGTGLNALEFTIQLEHTTVPGYLAIGFTDDYRMVWLNSLSVFVSPSWFCSYVFVTLNLTLSLSTSTSISLSVGLAVCNLCDKHLSLSLSLSLSIYLSNSYYQLLYYFYYKGDDSVVGCIPATGQCYSSYNIGTDNSALSPVSHPSKC